MTLPDSHHFKKLVACQICLLCSSCVDITQPGKDNNKCVNTNCLSRTDIKNKKHLHNSNYSATKERQKLSRLAETNWEENKTHAR